MTFPRNQPPHGIHGNAWDAVAVSSSGTSGTLDTQGAAFVTAFGNTSGSSTLTLQFSQDGTNWYDSSYTIAANGNFGTTFTVGARHVRLKSGSAVTITATLSAK